MNDRLLSEERIAELAATVSHHKTGDSATHWSGVLQRAAEEAIRTAVKEAGEAAANTSPNGADVSAADAPHVVWEKFAAEIRRRL